MSICPKEKQVIIGEKLSKFDELISLNNKKINVLINKIKDIYSFWFQDFNFPTDKLNFTVRLQLLKNDSFLGKLVHPVMFPFTKLLLEFKVTGSAEDPKWSYISVLDRIL